MSCIQTVSYEQQRGRHVQQEEQLVKIILTNPQYNISNRFGSKFHSTLGLPLCNPPCRFANLFNSLANAETIHLVCDVKYACGHYHLHASSPLQLREKEDVPTRSVFHRPVPVSQH